MTLGVDFLDPAHNGVDAGSTEVTEVESARSNESHLHSSRDSTKPRSGTTLLRAPCGCCRL